MSQDFALIQRGVENPAASFTAVAGGTPLDLTGRKVRATFRAWDSRFPLNLTAPALLVLDSDADIDSLWVDNDPTLGRVWVAITAAQSRLLAPVNERSKVSICIEQYDDQDPDNILFYRFLPSYPYYIDPESSNP